MEIVKSTVAAKVISRLRKRIFRAAKLLCMILYDNGYVMLYILIHTHRSTTLRVIPKVNYVH